MNCLYYSHHQSEQMSRCFSQLVQAPAPMFLIEKNKIAIKMWSGGGRVGRLLFLLSQDPFEADIHHQQVWRQGGHFLIFESSHMLTTTINYHILQNGTIRKLSFLLHCYAYHLDELKGIKIFLSSTPTPSISGLPLKS